MEDAQKSKDEANNNLEISASFLRFISESRLDFIYCGSGTMKPEHRYKLGQSVLVIFKQKDGCKLIQDPKRNVIIQGMK